MYSLIFRSSATGSTIYQADASKFSDLVIPRIGEEIDVDIPNTLFKVSRVHYALTSNLVYVLVEQIPY